MEGEREGIWWKGTKALCNHWTNWPEHTEDNLRLNANGYNGENPYSTTRYAVNHDHVFEVVSASEVRLELSRIIVAPWSVSTFLDET